LVIGFKHEKYHRLYSSVFSGFIYAQDIIYKKDNTKIEAKITEITPTEVKYKLFNYQDGPTIILLKTEVTIIIYQNGIQEVIDQTTPPTPSVYAAPQSIEVYREYREPNIAKDSIKCAMVKELLSTENLVSINILDPINGSFNVSYIREFAHNYLNVYISISIGFTTPNFTQMSNTLFTGYSNNYTYSEPNYFSVSDFSFTNKEYELGIGFHFQTSGKKQVTHFIGPYVSQSQFNGTYNKTSYVYSTGNNKYSINEYTELNKFTMDRLSLMIDNGVLFRLTKHFNVMLLVGFGYHIDSFKGEDLTKAKNYNPPLQRSIILNAYKFGVNFGYRF